MAFVLVRVRVTLAPETTAPLPSRTTPAPLPTASAKAQGETNRRPVKKNIWNDLRTRLARSKEFINPPEHRCGYAAFLAIIFLSIISIGLVEAMVNPRWRQYKSLFGLEPGSAEVVSLQSRARVF
jgi:hypothetical protein